jgi:hypothetical protein
VIDTRRLFPATVVQCTKRSVVPDANFSFRPQVGCGYPLNLSISLSGGKETKRDSLSNGERTGKRPALNPLSRVGSGKCGVWEIYFLAEASVPKSVGIRPRSPRG